METDRVCFEDMVALIDPVPALGNVVLPHQTYPPLIVVHYDMDFYVDFEVAIVQIRVLQLEQCYCLVGKILQLEIVIN
eukprot:CAMPEP_0116954192 /NCGR_PEP_ID=MMETSP0467-20121206/41781_1 /TAXON_ID=283647 /ORGANISM="Mesodinium pulex, Strain SPMC105" /LENGTH=77 /DNA_ID=CAMNT_0004639807 /DNA_START=333 /DNA_END=566 /DNA_ORIENTATION=+